MPNSKQLLTDLRKSITLQESDDEIESILLLLLEHYFHVTRADLLIGREITEYNADLISPAITRINSEEPIQYIIGKADFYGRSFMVSRSVLIPRPETEQLVDEVIRTVGKNYNGKILDIGTGSGCIAVTLANELRMATVQALDVSLDALAVAKSNARNLHANVTFFQSDILSKDISLDTIDLIVSNPPYITPSEKISMQKNVLDHEPDLALFVPENDPLLFYRAIVETGKRFLSPGGRVFAEINARFGAECAALFSREGYSDTCILKDLDRKDRIVFARSGFKKTN